MLGKIDLATRLDRHHIRGTFYHYGLCLFVIATIINWEMITFDYYTCLCMGLIIIDWFAEMYDPHPDNMGKWFEAHFHRIWDKE